MSGLKYEENPRNVQPVPTPVANKFTGEVADAVLVVEARPSVFLFHNTALSSLTTTQILSLDLLHHWL